MSNKIELVFENDEFVVLINGSEIKRDKDIRVCYERFKHEVSNNNMIHYMSWNEIEEEISKLNLPNVQFDNNFKNITYGSLKYFYNTEKVFYIKDGQMQTLAGGYTLFKFVVKMISEGHLDEYEELLELCSEIIENKCSYRFSTSSFFAICPGFDYGSAE